MRVSPVSVRTLLSFVKAHIARKMASMVTKMTKMVTTGAQLAKPRLELFWKYAKVELRPPTPVEIGEAAGGVQKLVGAATSGAWKKVSVKDALVNTAITAEVFCWFYIGECIGKGSLIGYQIPGATYYEIVI